MMDTRAIEAWLKKQMVSADAYDIKELLNAFLNEMELGLDGDKSSSLAMIPAFINAARGKVPKGKKVAAIDAGGENLRVCLAHFDEQGEIHLSNFSKQKMPGKGKEISAADFYKVLVDALEPMKDEFDVIGFCFSYPATISQNLDAKLLYWTKEVEIPELVGQNVGAGLVKALEERGCGKKQVAMLNDTVATLLAGMAKGQTFDAKGYVGFILGTGTNTAYIEQNRNISKLAGHIDENGEQVINVESGGFDRFERGPMDPEPADETDIPGFNFFEKVISGEYMGPLTLTLLKAAVNENFLSQTGAEAIASLEVLPTVHISNFYAGMTSPEDIGPLANEAFSADDMEVFKTVFGAIVRRASLLTALNISAAVFKSGVGREKVHPACITIDGSTYYGTPGMEEMVEKQLGEILGPNGPHGRRHFRCIEVKDAPIAGAAIAGLTAFS